MKVIAEGQVGDLGVGYVVKVEDGKLVVGAEADFGKLIDKGSSLIPDGSLKPIEVMILDIVKQSVKSI